MTQADVLILGGGLVGSALGVALSAHGLTSIIVDIADREKVLAAGHDLDRVLGLNDLVSSDNCFFAATGVTNGDMLRGVSYRADGATTRSLAMRSKSGTVRLVESRHKLSKLREYSAIDYSGPFN